MPGRLSRPIDAEAQRLLIIQDKNLDRQVLGRATHLNSGSIISIGADLGAADGKEGTLHAWVRWPGDVARGDMLVNSGGRFEFAVSADDEFSIIGKRPSDGATVLDMSSSSILDGKWHHCLSSWKLDAGPPVAHLFIDDSAAGVTIATATDDLIDYTRDDWSVGGGLDGLLNLSGDIAELWFDPSFIDISDVSRRRQFITERRTRKDLGFYGHRPLTGLPQLYMVGGPDTFRQNRGLGPDFLVNVEGQPLLTEWPPVRVGV